MFKKLALVFTVISILLVSSVTCFAAVDRYSVEILGFDVHNADNNTWYGLMRTQNQADVLTFSAGTTQNWFGTDTLVEGNYDKVRIVLGNSFIIRGKYDHGADTYWTDSTAWDLTGSPAVEKATKGTTSDKRDVSITLPYDAAVLNYVASPLNSSALVYYNGKDTSPLGKTLRYSDQAIMVRWMQSFTLKNGIPKALVVSWNVDNTLNETGYDAGTDTYDLNFLLPQITLTFVNE